MDVVIDKSKKGWHFALKQGKTTIFSSSRPNPIFYGEYGFYRSPEQAYGACKMMMFRNASVMEKVDGKVTMTEVQQGIVDGMLNRLNSFIVRLKEIRHDHENDDANSLQKTVPSLDKLISDSSKVISSIVSEIETNTSEVAALETGRVFTDKNVDNEASVYLLRIDRKMNRIKKRLKDDFAEFIEAGQLPEGPTPPPMESMGSSHGMCKYASLIKEDSDLLADIAADHVEKAVESLGSGHVRHIERTWDEGWSFLIKTARGEFCVRIGDDALFRGMFPAGKTCVEYPHMSLAFWNDIMKPVMNRIGHWLDSESGLLILPETVSDPESGTDDGSRVADVLKSFNIADGTKSACRVLSKRGRRVKGDLCRIQPIAILTVTASTNIESRVNALKDATMVMVTRPGSQYEGIAGSVDPERMKIRNDYIEIPVMIKFDTGLSTEVWMSDEDVEVYMGGGIGG